MGSPSILTTADIPEPRNGRICRPTATARFGSSRRESYDARAFYERFVGPELCNDTTIVRAHTVDVICCHDARDMQAVESSSVALVVTSPPYFAGKEYARLVGNGHRRRGRRVWDRDRARREHLERRGGE